MHKKSGARMCVCDTELLTKIKIQPKTKEQDHIFLLETSLQLEGLGISFSWIQKGIGDILTFFVE